MALRPWKTLSTERKIKNPWWEYRYDRFELPDGRPGEYHLVHTNGSSMVVPAGADGTILMVNQYRYLARRESLEFPCGAVKDGSTYEETAEHELREETGFVAEEMTLAGTFNPYNGVTDEFCRVYLARRLTHVGASPDDTEEFELLSLTVSEIDARIKDGSLWDGMSLAAWCIIKPQLIGG